ncbi:hypothetical protein [Actinoplanes sp. G11-F43]|uniref:hypothetical protein n=1 Tax=Actinoplanes sp. G11-F43 TaxID=3424130 RepID=UPI003D32C73B
MRGEFEVHLTVLGSERLQAAETAGREGLTFSDILLDGVDDPSRPTLSYRARGFLDDVIEAAHEERIRLRDCGLHPVRLKITADPNDCGTPETGRYAEQHLELRLPDASPDRIAELITLIEQYEARLSRDAARPDTAGGTQRFVTRRCPAPGRPSARAQLTPLVDALTSAGYEVVETEVRNVVCDTAPEPGGDRITEGRIAEGRIAEGRIAEGRIAEGRIAEGRIAEGRITGGRITGGRITEGRIAGDRIAEGRIIEAADQVPELSGRTDPWPWSLGRYDKGVWYGVDGTAWRLPAWTPSTRC